MYLADWTHSCAKSGNHWIYHVQWHWGGHCSLFCSMDFAGTAISYLGSIYHCHQRSQCCWNASTEQSDSTHLSAEKKSEENEGKPRPQPCSHWHLQYSCPSIHQWQTDSPGKGKDDILAIQLDLCFQEKRRKTHLLDERRHRQGINGQFSNWWNGDRQSHKETKSKNFTLFFPISVFAYN